jgi:hypothetical protein
MDTCDVFKWCFGYVICNWIMLIFISHMQQNISTCLLQISETLKLHVNLNFMIKSTVKLCAWLNFLAVLKQKGFDLTITAGYII